MSTGEEVRLARLFDGGSNAVVAAIDHGLALDPASDGMRELRIKLLAEIAQKPR